MHRGGRSDEDVEFPFFIDHVGWCGTLILFDDSHFSVGHYIY